MATLRQNNTWLNVPANAQVGRGGADLVLELSEDDVSRCHAIFEYRNDADGTLRFYVRDVGSTNGTFVDSQRIARAVPVRLTKGMSVRFGALGAPWIVVDDGPPNVAVVCDGRFAISSDDVQLLPAGIRPDFGVALARDTADRIVVRNRQVIEIGGERHTLLLHHTVELTAAPSFTRDVRLILRTSAARDTVRGATLVVGAVPYDLGRHVHNRELLALALARETDDRNQRPVAERGWRTARQLVASLGIDRLLLNVWTSRLRQRLRDIGQELLEDDPGGPYGWRRRIAGCDIEIREG